MTNRLNTKLLAATALFSCLLYVPAHAEGIAAGTLIENTAQATYTVAGVERTTHSNTVTIAVDEILDVAVASVDGGNVTLGAEGAVLAFQITNAGNGPEAFQLVADAALAGDDFDPVVSLMAYDSNSNGSYDDGVDTVIGPGGLTPELAADDTLRVFVVVALGSPQPGDADVADVRLRATAATGSGTPGTVFANQGPGGTNAVVGATTAIDADQGRLIARLSTVSLTKSATILDPFGGTQPVPGSLITYRLIASVAGSASITDLTVTDAIPTGTTYVPGTLTLNTTSLTDAADTDAGNAGSSGVGVTIANAPAGSDQTISFQVQINN